MTSTLKNAVILTANHVSGLGATGNVITAELGMMITETVVQDVAQFAKEMKLPTSSIRETEAQHLPIRVILY